MSAPPVYAAAALAGVASTFSNTWTALLHLGHGADRNPHVRLLVRREVAGDQHAVLEARLAELARAALDVHEHEVGLRIGRRVAVIGEPLLGEAAGRGVARLLLLHPGLRHRQRRLGALQRHDTDVADGVPGRHLGDGVLVADGVADAQTGHPEALREGARDDDARVLDRRRDEGLVARHRAVLEVGLVDQHRGVRRLLHQRGQIGAGVRSADGGGHRVVGIAVEHQAGALRGRLQGVEIHLQVGAELHAGDRVAHQPGVVGAFLVGGNRRYQPRRLGREDVGGGAEDLRRARIRAARSRA